MQIINIIQFSKDNLEGLAGIQAKNELVRGMLTIVLHNRFANREFDCNSEKFWQNLNQMNNEYKSFRKKAINSQIKNMTPELERLIVNIDSFLTNIIQELKNDRPSEINLSTYLVRLTRYTNEVEDNYKNILYPKSINDSLQYNKDNVINDNNIMPAKMSLFRRFRESRLAKWILGGATAATIATTTYKTSLYDGNVKPNTIIEVQAQTPIDTPSTKKMTVAEMNKIPEKKTESNKIEEVKRISVQQIKTPKLAETKTTNLKKMTRADLIKASKNEKLPFKAPPGYKFLFAKDNALVTAYNPTGKGLMAGVNPDGTPYEETGKTSTNFDALNNFKGVAVDPKIIPYGSLIFIEGVGWRVADDTGADMHHSWDNFRIVHIDMRKKSYDDAIQWGNPKKKIYVFKNVSGKDFDDRVREARKAFEDKNNPLYATLNRSWK